MPLRASTRNGRTLHWAATSISLQRMGKITRGLWATIYSRMCGSVLTWWNHRSVWLNPRFLPFLTSLRYTTDTAISLTTSCRIQTSATMACLLITPFRQTPVPLCLVSIYRFLYSVVDPFPSLGWSLFVAAMTTNKGLSSGLIWRVFNTTGSSKSTTNPAFAVYYDSANGTPLQGVGR